MKFTKYFLLIFLISCKEGNRSSQTSENNIDAARNFIRAALDGKFNDARAYMLQDSLNLNFMEVVERAYRNMDQETKDGYRTSTIRILSKKELDDSTSIVVYANSFKNDPDTLKVLKRGDTWLVDFKYLYLHPLDTLMHPVQKDSLP
jgi:hypothetical protein